MRIIVTAPPPNRSHWSSVLPKELMASGSEKVYCGQLLTQSHGVVGGHGTRDSKNRLLASVCGSKVQHSCLIQIQPRREKYHPRVGDVVVGRIVRVRKAQWMVDINHRMDAVLHLYNTNLPGGALRRKNAADEVFMREHLRVGDLVCAEVQQVRGKGQAILHTRNLRHGKLGQGIMVKVWPTLVKQQRQHMHEMLGLGVILGCNGIIWISSILFDHFNGGYAEDLSWVISREKRHRMVRLAACIRMLANNLICIYDISVQAAYLASRDYEIKDLALPQVQASLLPTIVEMIMAEEKRRLGIRDREKQEAP
ncbi:exosome non-catalytic core subunit rrp4 [Parelaphostrongylus tenuis]|uniref:Exosome non-catalytic core subunit rrp4 n=1 Tax=Parelaphostrongylus tenuis TaxID=148309 RepID=A0AAD5M2R4_PARTN|nr:exosome non-catalytic core subunit rrp4 [Parelaphostrongylus tenuis]